MTDDIPKGIIYGLDMLHTVKLNKHDLNYFRRLARDSEKEIEAYLIGEVINPLTTRIDEFIYPKKYDHQKANGVSWSPEDMENAYKRADETGKRVVGSIHTHPEWDAVFSPTDYKQHIKVGFRISGICSIMDRKTRVRFWIAESALPCKILYE